MSKLVKVAPLKVSITDSVGVKNILKITIYHQIPSWWYHGSNCGGGFRSYQNVTSDPETIGESSRRKQSSIWKRLPQGGGRVLAKRLQLW